VARLRAPRRVRGADVKRRRAFSIAEASTYLDHLARADRLGKLFVSIRQICIDRDDLRALYQKAYDVAYRKQLWKEVEELRAKKTSEQTYDGARP